MSEKLCRETSVEKFWAGQRGVIFIALVSGVSFGVMLSFVKGLCFALFILCLMEPFIFYGLWRSRKLKLKVGSHELIFRSRASTSEIGRAVKLEVCIARRDILFPPVDVEFLWAEKQDESGLYKIINTPFFAPGISYGDIVVASKKGSHLTFDKILHFSNHSRLLMFVCKHKLIGEISSQLGCLGCNVEHNYVKGVMSVDVPGEVNYSLVLELLSGYRDAKKIVFEEPVLRHMKNR